MRCLIVGNSAAGIGAAESIRSVDKNCEIVVVGDEPHHVYSRPLISHFVAGETTADGMRSRPEYTSEVLLGANIGIADTAQVIELQNIVNDLGLDVSSTGTYLAWAIELYERGMIDRTMTGRKTAGHRIDRESFSQMLDEYYALHGWDNDGRPPRGRMEEFESL